ncbi:SH3 domain-containing protein [Colletotrichum spaethianum]|uniref:SH3 domain-containing protein n=1 Tax=Colletotrichum spaethianum TaxID=700344 RepID=A0AA37LES3_9PEZI|nr:SH3 domain-containing protein [Colletotrichum spaethianum]GKT47321.1 SH3 domain-containing protein [Colletotrichum spaethianum]
MSTAPFRVKALFEYSSPHEDDLQFPAGVIITVTDEEDADWYSGEYVDDAGAKHEGIFPRNFVEKIEPQAPPRPTRTRPKKEAEVTSPVAEAPAPAPQPDLQPAQEARHEVEQPAPPAPAALPTSPEAPAAPEPEPVKAPEPVPEPTPVAPISKASEPPAATSPPIAKASPAPAKPGPPPKPSSNAFKDRIAAFNKASAAPIAPFKPSGLAQGSYHIKKPFVAPPPSRNAYVPPPSQAPVAKVYRRDEDPEILEREAENQESAERAGMVPGPSGEEGEDAPKPTSLKERIALLQRQQQEQAQRHAEAAAKKEKAKRPPPKKRTDSQEASEDAGAAAPVPAPEADTDEAAGRSSVDSPRMPPAPRRKSSRGPATETYHDGNEADMSGAGDTEGPEDLTERDDSDAAPRPVPRPQVASPVEARKEDEQVEEEGEEEEEDDDVDPEVRRKEELRARMAKMSGGMGMHGMFGIPMGAPAIPKKKKTADRPAETSPTGEREEETTSPVSRVPVPGMMALPGMGAPRRQEEPAAADEPEPPTSPRAPPPPPRTVEEDDVEDEPVTSPPPSPRPPPIPPTSGLKSPSEGSESDDELSGGAQDTPKPEEARAPPPLPPVATSVRSPPPIPGSEFSPTSPTSSTNKRMSRVPPPIPGAAPPIPTAQSRPPPPPPPGGPLSRQSTQDMHIASPISPPIRPPPQGEDEDEVTEYEGDYDTDIASSVPHKDALKSHARDSSLDDNTSVRSPISDAPPTLPPPIPTGPPPRAAPPPVPMQPPSEKRRSVDVPRAAPPPPPPARDDDEYDPYNYAAPKVPYSQRTPMIEEEGYFQDTPPLPSPSHTRAPPPAPPGGRARQSMDVSRASMSQRRSMDAHRPSVSVESGFIANDIDLAKQSGWWRQDKTVPPVLQGRRDLYYETVDSTSGSHVTRTIYVLFQDYSQTIITVEYDQNNAADVMLDQRHDPPPRALRQDELEQSYERFGRPISEAVTSKKETVVGDGTPQGLIHELLKPFSDALAPIGTRAYGALVYSNMANASTQQNDQIRPGDIISIRNARFQGKHGPMHAKYSMEVGKPDHVAVVSEWDGTKKKVRAWEQGRESKKVKVESFKLDDLRSGEVKIWRVMPRSWVGWNSPS